MTPNCQSINTVGDLRKAIADLPDDTEVIGTWEGIEMAVFAYVAADGRLILDEDRGNAITQYQQTKCCDCDKLAAQYVTFPDGVLPVCYTHWSERHAALPEEDNG